MAIWSWTCGGGASTLEESPTVHGVETAHRHDITGAMGTRMRAATGFMTAAVTAAAAAAAAVVAVVAAAAVAVAAEAAVVS
jgi:hypothetical protein